MEYFMERESRLEELESGEIDISVKYLINPPRLLFSIKDSGAGFDYSNLLSEADSDHNFGRGVALVRELCDGLDYSEEGTKVAATFLIDMENSPEFD